MNLLVDDNPTAVEMPEAQEEVSSVVVLLPLALHVLTDVVLECNEQLCKDAIEGRAGTAGRGERDPGELADCCGFRRRGLSLGDDFWHQRFGFCFHGCWGGWGGAMEPTLSHGVFGRGFHLRQVRIRVSMAYI